MDRSMSRVARVAAAVFTVCLCVSATAGADVYLSLGDSVGFGIEDSMTTASYGISQGYVKDYADYLAARNGTGVPTVINLAVPGETSSSFFSGSGRIGPDNLPPTSAEDAALVALNRNYTAFASMNHVDPPTQPAFLEHTIATYGSSISTVTIRLGPDDLFATALTPGFFGLRPDQQAAAIGQTLQTYAANEAALILDLKSKLPGARIILVGSYNPFPAGFPSPFTPLAGPAIQGLNNVTEGLAKSFQVDFANPYDAFVGNELTDTYVLDNGNVHPNAAGYSLIAASIEAVPEPSTFVLTGLGLTGAGVVAQFRRRRKAA